MNYSLMVSQPPYNLQKHITHILKSLPADLTTNMKAKFQSFGLSMSGLILLFVKSSLSSCNI